jgi:hypothetical protein
MTVSVCGSGSVDIKLMAFTWHRSVHAREQLPTFPYAHCILQFYSLLHTLTVIAERVVYVPRQVLAAAQPTVTPKTNQVHYNPLTLT